MGKPIPDDGLFEILRILPVKSLQRFQLVSKSFDSLIHNPIFISSHLNLAVETNSSSIISLDRNSSICFSRMDSPASLLTYSCENPGKSLKVIGSCNGLLCLSFQNSCVIITNLLIKDHHITPIPESNPKGSFSVYGFIYNSSVDDYKVLKIVVCRGKRRLSHCFAETTIYSLRSNTWSKIKRWDGIGERQGFPLCFEQHHGLYAAVNGVVVSSALHWLAYHLDKKTRSSCPLVLAFDITAEEFYEIALPDRVVDESTRLNIAKQIGVLNGRLCLSIGAAPGKPFYDFWVMDEYKSKTSWTKLVRFMLNSPRKIPTPLTLLIYFKKDEQVLLSDENREGFHLCDMRNKLRIGCASNFVTPSIFPLCQVEAICLNTLVSVDPYRALWMEEDSIWKGRLRKRRREEESSIEMQVQALRGFSSFRDKVISSFF